MSECLLWKKIPTNTRTTMQIKCTTTPTMAIGNQKRKRTKQVQERKLPHTIVRHIIVFAIHSIVQDQGIPESNLSPAECITYHAPLPILLPVYRLPDLAVQWWIHLYGIWNDQPRTKAFGPMPREYNFLHALVSKGLHDSSKTWTQYHEIQMI